MEATELIDERIENLFMPPSVSIVVRQRNEIGHRDIKFTHRLKMARELYARLGLMKTLEPHVGISTLNQNFLTPYPTQDKALA